MRSKETLLEFNDIAIFFQYLYIDEKNRITFDNGLTNLTLRMTDNLSIMCKNESFTDLPETDFSSELHPYNVLSIIDILKVQPPIEHPNHFNNRWEEIKNITQINLSLNIK